MSEILTLVIGIARKSVARKVQDSVLHVYGLREPVETFFGAQPCQEVCPGTNNARQVDEHWLRGRQHATL